MKIVKANKKGIELAVKYLKAGKVVVYPTDTAYGLGVDATNVRAVKRLLKIKERKNQPVHVIVQNLTAVKKLAIVSPEAFRIMKRFWPGALTVVLPTLPPLNLPLPFGRGRKGKDFLPHDKGEKKEGVESLKLLSAGTGTIGIRMPDNKVALELVKKIGRPITTPSANPSAHLSGGTTPYSVQDSYRQFRDKKYQPDLYLDAGRLQKRRPSTLVSVKNGKIKILRRGPVVKKQILKVLGSSL